MPGGKCSLPLCFSNLVASQRGKGACGANETEFDSPSVFHPDGAQRRLGPCRLWNFLPPPRCFQAAAHTPFSAMCAADMRSAVEVERCVWEPSRDGCSRWPVVIPQARNTSRTFCKPPCVANGRRLESLPCHMCDVHRMWFLSGGCIWWSGTLGADVLMSPVLCVYCNCRGNPANHGTRFTPSLLCPLASVGSLPSGQTHYLGAPETCYVEVVKLVMVQNAKV